MTHQYKANCSTDNLKLIREFVKVVLTNYQLSKNEINQLVTVVDEVCSNLIIHSNECDASKHIEINIENAKSNNTITFKIIDNNSIFFDPTQYEPPTLDKIIEERRRGGLGLKIIQKIMDSIEVKQNRAGSGNIWTLSKQLR